MDLEQAKSALERFRKEKEKWERFRFIARPFQNKKFEGKVVGIDGGLVTKQLHGLSITLVRAARVVFEWDGGIKSIQRYVEPLDIQIDFALDNETYHNRSNLYRIYHEVNMALKSEGDLIILDGSIIPQPPDKPKDEEGKRIYGDIIGMYEKLLKKDVIGVIEDSTSKALARQYNINSIDTIFLSFMQDGEIVGPISYDSPILNDFGEPPSLWAFYLKVGKDVPLRIECKEGDDIDKIASLVYSLSRHTFYSYPSILIEADKLAKIKREEVEEVCKRLGILPFEYKRRERRVI